MLMNQRGLERLLADKFSIGADLAAAAGPVGRDAKVDTDLLLKAEILSWSRTRGVFAGVSLNGTVVESDRSEAIKLYGRAWSTREIIRGGIAMPDAAKFLATRLPATFTVSSGRGSRSRRSDPNPSLPVSPRSTRPRPPPLPSSGQCGSTPVPECVRNARARRRVNNNSYSSPPCSACSGLAPLKHGGAVISAETFEAAHILFRSSDSPSLTSIAAVALSFSRINRPSAAAVPVLCAAAEPCLCSLRGPAPSRPVRR